MFPIINTEFPTTELPTALLQSTTDYIGALAGVSSVATLYFILSVAIMIALIIRNKSLK